MQRDLLSVEVLRAGCIDLRTRASKYLSEAIGGSRSQLLTLDTCVIEVQHREACHAAHLEGQNPHNSEIVGQVELVERHQVGNGVRDASLHVVAIDRGWGIRKVSIFIRSMLACLEPARSSWGAKYRMIPSTTPQHRRWTTHKV